MAHVPYASVVGSLMCAMVCTQPNISHVVGVLRRYMSTLRKEHLNSIKRMFKYLCGTTEYAIYYQGKPETRREVNVHSFVNADWAGDLDRRRSTNIYVLRLFGGEISWMSKRQVVVSLSIKEDKYMETK
jgi:hypothetical protein